MSTSLRPSRVLSLFQVDRFVVLFLWHSGNFFRRQREKVVRNGRKLCDSAVTRNFHVIYVTQHVLKYDMR